MKRPDFFCVGAAKSGTSAMHYYLRQHPQIFMPRLKEIHHFAGDLLKPDDPWLDLETYLKLFENARDNQLIGETSVFYLLSERAAKNIKSYNPAAKIIMMLRNPVEVAHSLHAQLIYNGEEDIIDFNEALEAETDRMAGKRQPHRTRIIKKHWYRYVVEFSDQIKRFKECFESDNIHYIIFDDFKADNIVELKKTLLFLGVDHNFEPEIKTVNPSKVIRNRKLQEFKTWFVSKWLTAIFDQPKLQAIDQYLTRMNTRYVAKTPIDPKIKQRLQAEFKGEIDKLSELLDRDLSFWYE